VLLQHCRAALVQGVALFYIARPFTFAEFRSAISGSQFDLQARVDDPTAKNGS